VRKTIVWIRNGACISTLPLLLGALMIACAFQPDPLGDETDATALRHPPAGSVLGGQGRYGGRAWHGIPYAVPPIGPNRFRAPVPLPAWEGTRRAVDFGASCPQYASIWGGEVSEPKGSLVGSEDCLFLNIYAPKDALGERLPVMFWIHGGGNTIGTTTFYDASRLASQQRVVVVTVNYRLGFLGWFRHAALREGADRVDASGNFGTLDLILALDWVQKNIASFGGDPGNVTIFGESAGSWNVLSLLASPLASGKFHRAIGQTSVTWSTKPARAENFVDDPEPGHDFSSGEILLRLLVAAGNAEDRQSAKRRLASMSSRETADFLRSRSVEQLFAAYDPDDARDYDTPLMFEDGFVLPATPLAQAFRPGATFNRVPVMLGSNKDEEKLFLFFHEDYTSHLFGFFPRLKNRSRYMRDAETITRIWRMLAVDELAKDLSREMPGEVFAYRFDWDEEPSILWIDLGELLGASHGFEVPFIFGHWYLGPQSNFLFDESNRRGREALSAAMMSYWTEFAKNGHPARGRDGNLPLWSAWTEGAHRFNILDTKESGGMRMAEGSETAQDIAASILEDTSYQSVRYRCRALAAIHDWAPSAFTPTDYAEAGRGFCHAYPLHDLLESN